MKIAIVEDQTQLLKTLKEALTIVPFVEIIWTARNGKVAIEKLTTQPEKPQVILMDIEMPVLNGIEATKQAKQYFPEIPIVIFTVFDDDKNVFDAILAGASGYLLKGEKPMRIIQGLRDAIENRMPMSPKIAMKAISFLREKIVIQPESSILPEDFKLTKRELEILEQISKGKTYPEVAENLFISKDTVRNHVTKIYKKMRVKSKAEVIQMASKHKWFET